MVSPLLGMQHRGLGLIHVLNLCPHLKRGSPLPHPPQRSPQNQMEGVDKTCAEYLASHMGYVPHGWSQSPLVPSREPAGNFPIWWLVQLTSRGPSREILKRWVQQMEPHRPSGWWLKGTSGPQGLRHCLRLQPSLEALPSEPQPSSESVAEWKQLDICRQKTRALVPASPLTEPQGPSPSPRLGGGAGMSVFSGGRCGYEFSTS